jgi:hypothetical protein
MAVLWFLLEATDQSFGGLAGRPRSDKPFGLTGGSAPPPADSVSPAVGASVPPASEPSFRLPAASAFPPASAFRAASAFLPPRTPPAGPASAFPPARTPPAAPAPLPPSFPVSAVRRVPASVVAPAAREDPGRETQPTVTAPAQACARTAAVPHADIPAAKSTSAAKPTSAVRESPSRAPDSVEESVTVVSRSRRPGTPAQPWTPVPNRDQPVPADWSRPTIGARPGASRDLGAASAARRKAFIVGSRAREAILGYGFANPDAAMGGPPQAGEEPAPGHTVVLIGDDVEAWVRERLYGGRIPTR